MAAKRADFFTLIDRNIGTLPTMDNNVITERKRGPVMEILILIVFLAAWFILQAWVLPRFGVKT